MLTYQMAGYGMGMMTVQNAAPLNVVSYGLGQMFAWAAGCGVHRFKLTFDKNRVGMSVFMDPLVEPQVIQAASCSRQMDLHTAGLLPLDIPEMERMNMDGNQSVCWDGAARFSFNEGNGMLVQTYNVKPQLSIAEWAFAYSDHCTGFFWRGVREIKVFHSMKLTQFHMSPGLPEAVVRAMMTNAEDYPQDTLVSSVK